MSNLLKAAALSEAQAQELRAAAVAAAEPEIVTLAVAIARKILGAELSLAPDKIQAIGREAIALAGARGGLTLVVHPDDAGRVAGLGRPVRVDPAIARGGCVVESPVGTIDARIETQLASLERALREGLA